MDCPKCGYMMTDLDATCPRCKGAGISRAARPATVAAPPRHGDLPPPAATSTVEVFVPYRNPNALASYYLGIFSPLPFLGAIMGAVAVVLGIKGLRLVRAYPEARGATHAWVGIICGGFFGLLNLLVLIAPLLAAAFDR